jgi:hypothetical protein
MVKRIPDKERYTVFFKFVYIDCTVAFCFRHTFMTSGKYILKVSLA